MEQIKGGATMGKLRVYLKLISLPLLLFALLVIPYSWVNQRYIVEWFGCGCPKVDEFGNIIDPAFNANDFTGLFWAFVAVGAGVMACFLSKGIPKEKRWLRIGYITAIFLISFLIAHQFYRMMMWN